MKRISLAFLLLLIMFPLVTLADAQPLPETYISDDGTLTLHYPAGWMIQADQPGLVVVATDESLLRIGEETIPSGEAVVAMLFSNADDAYLRAYFSGDDSITVLD